MGRGEIAIRLATARSVVLYLKQGLGLAAACVEAMGEVRQLLDPFHSDFSIIAVDTTGAHFAASNVPGRSYLYITEDMAEPVVAARVTLA